MDSPEDRGVLRVIAGNVRSALRASNKGRCDSKPPKLVKFDMERMKFMEGSGGSAMESS